MKIQEKIELIKENLEENKYTQKRKNIAETMVLYYNGEKCLKNVSSWDIVAINNLIK